MHAEQSSSAASAATAKAQESIFEQETNGGREQGAVPAGAPGGGGDQLRFSAWQTLTLTVPEVPKPPAVDIEGAVSANKFSTLMMPANAVVPITCCVLLEADSRERWQM